MNVLVSQKVKLGLPDGLLWRQDKVSVPYWRVYWNDAPGAFVKDAAGEIELGPGLVAAIPPRTVYSTRTTGCSTHFYAHFTASQPFETIMPGIIALDAERLLALAASIARDFHLDSPPDLKAMLKVHIYLYELLLAIPDCKLPSEKKLDPRIEMAAAILDANPSLTLDQLAMELKMSRSVFLELFHRETGSAPQRLSRRRRLEKACMLLHYSDKSIKQIAEETGFCDRYHFSRLFKREFSYGPAEFRSQMDAYKHQQRQ